MSLDDIVTIGTEALVIDGALETWERGKKYSGKNPMQTFYEATGRLAEGNPNREANIKAYQNSGKLGTQEVANASNELRSDLFGETAEKVGVSYDEVIGEIGGSAEALYFALSRVAPSDSADDFARLHRHAYTAIQESKLSDEELTQALSKMREEKIKKIRESDEFRSVAEITSFLIKRTSISDEVQAQREIYKAIIGEFGEAIAGNVDAARSYLDGIYKSAKEDNKTLIGATLGMAVAHKEIIERQKAEPKSPLHISSQRPSSYSMAA
ncbi:MAG: hypothetical protein Q8P57_01490 [Candidatus Pacearchaeota archaeon]|nr:hypothetical protein [Candidatus Pacearchaeota archaeon]